MASFCTYVLFLLTNIFFLSNVLTSHEETNKLLVTEDYDIVDDSYEPTAEQMLRDQAVGTTPAVCPVGQKCAFKIIDNARTGYHHHDLVHYCHCPEGEDCLPVARNKEKTYIYYKCFSREDPKTTTESLAQTVAGDLTASTSEGTSEGLTASTSEGTSEGLTASTSEGTSEGLTASTSEGTSEGLTASTSEGTSEGLTASTSEGTSESLTASTSEGTSGGLTASTSEGLSGSTTVAESTTAAVHTEEFTISVSENTDSPTLENRYGFHVLNEL